MDRRTFVAALGAAGTAASLPLDHLWALGPSQLDKIGIQLYTFRSMMSQSVEKTLSTVAEIGYKEVEFAGYFNRPPRALRQLLDRNGLTAPSAHIDLATVKDKWMTTLNDAAEIGHKYMVVASLGNNDRNSVDAIKRTAEIFNKAGEDALKFKIQLGYHNHNTEFQLVEGKRMYDVFLEATDPKFVVLELDLHWIYNAGADPFAYFSQYPGRFPLIHAKDIGPQKQMMNVGAGTIKWADIFAKTKEAGIKHVFVEHDNAKDVVADTTESFKYLKALRFTT